MTNTGKLRGVAGALALILGFGAAAGSLVQAQQRCYPNYGPYNRSYGYNGPYGNSGYNGPYGNGGYYGPYNGGYYGGGSGGGYYGGNYGGYYASESVAHGYRDGFNRGREDARDGRYPTPNNSEHFRNGNPAYRSGFARGYQAGFRQYIGGYGGYGAYGGYRPF